MQLTDTSFLHRFRLLLLWLIAISAPGTLFALDQEHQRTDSILEYSVAIAGKSTDAAIRLVDSLIAVYDRENYYYGIGRAKSLKSWFLVYQARYEESLKLGHAALKIQENRTTDTLGIGMTYNRLGLTNMYFKREDDAFKYIEKALAIFTELQDTAMLDLTLNNLGVLYSNRQEYDKSVEYGKRVLNLRLGTGNYKWIAYAYFNIGATFRLAGRLDSAEFYTEQARQIFLANKLEVPSQVYISLSEFAQNQGEYETALGYAKMALEIGIKQDHTQVILFSKKLLSNLYHLNGDDTKAYELLSEYHTKREALDSANSATAIAEIEEKYENAEKEIEIAELRASSLEASNAAQQSKLLLLYSIIALSIVIFLFSFFYLRKVQKQKIQTSELNAKIASTRLMALRAQMNPHFIFNCLNTTQNFIMASKKREAYEYLSKFAKLIRLILQNSQHTFIPLESEMSQIRLYLELECIRFNEKFTFDINISHDLRNKIYDIPGMIIQPLVENAILHGLINRDDSNGHVSVNMRRINNELIECEIQDNGVGREKAAQIKERKKIHYKPVALPNIMERLQILLKHHKAEVKVGITDLYENSRPSGTKVSLFLPYQ